MTVILCWAPSAGPLNKAKIIIWNTAFIWPDGCLHWVEGRGKFYREQTGIPARMLGICLDITERKRAEEELRESPQRFTRFMQYLPGLAWLKNLQGRYLYVNDHAEVVFGLPREKLCGKTDEEIFRQKRPPNLWKMTAGRWTVEKVCRWLRHSNIRTGRSIIPS